METTLQLNGHVTRAFRHSNSWCWWYCRKGSVTPQHPQSWGRMSHSPACLSTSPRGNVCMQPWWVHWTGSWRHCCWWLEMFSNGPVQLHPSALLTQYNSSESTTLSKVIMPLTSEAWRGCLPTGQFLLPCKCIHCLRQPRQKRCPSLHATALRMTYWLYGKPLTFPCSYQLPPAAQCQLTPLKL